MSYPNFRKCARCKMNVDIGSPGFHKEDPPAGKKRAKYYHNECWRQTSAELALADVGVEVFVAPVERKPRLKNASPSEEKTLVLNFLKNELGMTTKDAEKRMQEYFNDGISTLSMWDALRYYHYILGKDKVLYGHWVIARYHQMGKRYYDRVRFANARNAVAGKEVPPQKFTISPREVKQKNKKEYELE